MTANQLHIESAQGQLIVEYRIQRGFIEVRVPGEGGAASWRRLSAREFSAHLTQNPVLAEWLRARAQRNLRQAEDEPSAA